MQSEQVASSLDLEDLVGEAGGMGGEGQSQVVVAGRRPGTEGGGSRGEEGGWWWWWTEIENG